MLIRFKKNDGTEYPQWEEKKLGSILEVPTIQEQLFPEFNGLVKSLGAWGGDFVMAISKENPKDYFVSKGYETILTYDEMILQQ